MDLPGFLGLSPPWNRTRHSPGSRRHQGPYPPGHLSLSAPSPRHFAEAVETLTPSHPRSERTLSIRPLQQCVRFSAGESRELSTVGGGGSEKRGEASAARQPGDEGRRACQPPSLQAPWGRREPWTKKKKKAHHLRLRQEKCQGEGGKRTLQSPVLGENARVEGAESRKPRRNSGSSAFLVRFGF